MNKIISDYQKWKQQGDDLRRQAKEAMETRFKELLTEAVQIAEEYRSDFGVALKPPTGVTAFRYKAGAKAKPKKTAPKAKSENKAAAPPVAPPKPNPAIPGLQKRLATARQKLEQAKTNGAPTKNLEDKIYELEDALQLAEQA